jgi:hypothetical protein
VPVRLAPNQPREAGDSVWETDHLLRTSLKHCFSLATGINARLVSLRNPERFTIRA